MSLALVVLVYGRPGSDWFEHGGGAAIFYGLWVAAVVLALIGVRVGLFGKGMRVRARLVAAGVSGVTLALTVFLVWAIADFVSHVR